MDTKKNLEKENLPIMPFRGSKLGIIRLSKLAKIETVIVSVGGIKFKPIGFDTYGHPILSEDTFSYYKALKSITERKGGSLLAEIEYESSSFCIKEMVYDSALAIETAIKADLSFEIDENGKTIPKELVKNPIINLKNVLINRKKAHFIGKKLHRFVIFNKYVLDTDGHIYSLDSLFIKPENEIINFQAYDNKTKESVNSMFMSMRPINQHKAEEKWNSEREKYEYVISENEIQSISFSRENEVHIPGPNDVCGICGQPFLMNDVIEGKIGVNSKAQKQHKECAIAFKDAMNNELASQIVDAVYDGKPEMEIKTDFEDGEEKIRYLFHTTEGDISIRIKRKVIEIIWYENFKPFNLEEIFEKEIVTKFANGKKRVIHAWSAEDAKRYLLMAKKS